MFLIPLCINETIAGCYWHNAMSVDSIRIGAALTNLWYISSITWDIPECPWDYLESGTERIWDLTPLAKDYLGYPRMLLGLLGIREKENLGFDAPGTEFDY